jgi:tRNA(Arg) A34 adenosine deaminase TadA
MDLGRRGFLGGVALVVLTEAATSCGRSENSARPDAGADSSAAAERDVGTSHERFMRMAIEQARSNPAYPFGAVIVATSTGEVLASGVNTAVNNPMLHGEVAAMNDYLHRHGNQGWAATTLYTTGEPCSMCMSAMVWANLRRVVWGSSIDDVRCTGISQIAVSAQEVAASARSFYTPDLLLGGVLAGDTDRLFQEAQRLRQSTMAKPPATASCHS